MSFFNFFSSTFSENLMRKLQVSWIFGLDLASLNFRKFQRFLKMQKRGYKPTSHLGRLSIKPPLSKL